LVVVNNPIPTTGYKPKSSFLFQGCARAHEARIPKTEASFQVLDAVPQIMDKVKLFQDRILTDTERLALATGAAAHRWEDFDKARSILRSYVE
jgi:hypothetical protein